MSTLSNARQVPVSRARGSVFTMRSDPPSGGTYAGSSVGRSVPPDSTLQPEKDSNSYGGSGGSFPAGRETPFTSTAASAAAKPQRMAIRHRKALFV